MTYETNDAARIEALAALARDRRPLDGPGVPRPVSRYNGAGWAFLAIIGAGVFVAGLAVGALL
jgi:hypothetical protein